MIVRLAALGFLFAALACVSLASPVYAEPAWQTLPPLEPLPSPGAEGRVDHDGAQIYYRTFGAGMPVILLHGGLASSDYWGNQVLALAQAGYRAILIDSRGHGRSSRDGRPFTYELMESDVVAVMDRLGIGKAALVGWSDGAIVGLVMALKNPERLTRVFAFAANMDPSGVKPDTDGNPNFARFHDRAGTEYAAISPTPNDYPAFAQAIEHMWDTEPNYTAADLARIKLPVTIADGDHDEAIKREHTDYLARAIPGARLVILPEASHFAMLQQPEAFNRAIFVFLKTN